MQIYSGEAEDWEKRYFFPWKLVCTSFSQPSLLSRELTSEETTFPPISKSNAAVICFFVPTREIFLMTYPLLKSEPITCSRPSSCWAIKRCYSFSRHSFLFFFFVFCFISLLSLIRNSVLFMASISMTYPVLKSEPITCCGSLQQKVLLFFQTFFSFIPGNPLPAPLGKQFLAFKSLLQYLFIAKI